MDLHLVMNQQQRERFLGWLVVGEEKRGWLGVDTETTGLGWHDQLRMVQFGDKDSGWALPYPEEANLIADVLSDYKGAFVAHNVNFDKRFLKHAGLCVDRLFHDTKVMAHLLDSAGGTHLKDLAVRYLSIGLDEKQKKLQQAMRKNKWTWATVPVSEPAYWQYAALDPVLTAKLADRLTPLVDQQFYELYAMEVEVAQTLFDAEMRGFHIDREYAEAQMLELQNEILDLVERHPDVNLGSPKQVAEALDLKGRTEKGNPRATAADLALVDDPLARDVLAYREKSKLFSTYFENFTELADEGGYIHPTVNTVGPRTGRMSCERPNLQNVPRGSRVRPCFTASLGNILVMADYAQIEYRLFASYAHEERMIQAFLDGKDMHAETARIILGREPTKEERTVAKTANFAMLYGAGAAKFAETAGISLAEAKEFMSRYETEFPQTQLFMQAVMKYATSSGFMVETNYGRRCPVDRNQLYAAVNYMIQGTAADVLKQAIVRVHQSRWDQYLVLPVHDELIFDVPEALADELMAELPDLMEVRDVFEVPLTIEVKKQHRWGLAEEVMAA